MIKEIKGQLVELRVQRKTLSGMVKKLKNKELPEAELNEIIAIIKANEE